jgi:hypothetical protein
MELVITADHRDMLINATVEDMIEKLKNIFWGRA